MRKQEIESRILVGALNTNKQQETWPLDDKKGWETKIVHAVI
jgi:hypothetical protein